MDISRNLLLNLNKVPHTLTGQQLECLFNSNWRIGLDRRNFYMPIVFIDLTEVTSSGK